MIKFKEVIEIYRQEVEPFMYRLTVGLPILFIILTTWNYLIIIHICNIRLFTLQVDLLLYLLVFNVFSSILIWFFSFRKQKKFKGDEVGILIALTKLDEKTDEDLTKLYKHLEHLINTKNFRSRVMVRMIPTHLIPKKESEAHKLREKINAQLIVWGNVDKGKNLSESQTVFIPIYFSYQLCLPLDKAVVIKNSFDHVIANRKWIISENNNIFDREYVARNLEEVSLYMISAVLFFAQRKDEALEIIKNVLDKYQVKTTLTYDDNIAIINIKILRFEIFRRENIKLKFGPLVKAGAKEKNIKIAEELITNEKNNGEPELSLLLEAQVEFARRDIHKAILRAKEACVLSKDISPACFTLAFLYFYKEDHHFIFWAFCNCFF